MKPLAASPRARWCELARWRRMGLEIGMKIRACWIGCSGLLLMWAMAGCGAGNPPPSPPPSSPKVAEPPSVDDTGNLCPDAPSMSVALPISTPEGVRWMMHEREMEDQDVLFPRDSEEGARRLTQAEAKQHGPTSASLAVWVYLQDEAPPCRMESGAPWAVRHGDAELRTHVFSELTGDCALVEDVPSYLVLRAVDEARGCRFHGLPRIGADADGKGEPPLPEAVKAVLPPHRCEGDGCFRWMAHGTRVDDGTGVYEVAAVWIQPLEGDEPPCAAPFDGYHGVFYSAAREGAWREIPDVTGVRGLLYDRRGLRAVVTDARGVLGLLLPSDGGVPRPHWQQRYMTWNEENRTPLEDIQPSCL